MLFVVIFYIFTNN